MHNYTPPTFHRFSTINVWGSLVNKENNSFNGMIGMVQRKVDIFYTRV